MYTQERKELDNEYAENYSFMMDFKIFFLTIPAVFQTEEV